MGNSGNQALPNPDMFFEHQKGLLNMEQEGLIIGERVGRGAWLVCEPGLEETEKLELKRSTSELKEAIISISAILNKHKKGALLFGVAKDGNAIGQQANESTLREISQAIANNIEPRIYPEIKAETVDGKSCVKVSFEGQEQPYFAYGRAHMRVADEDKQLSVKELEKLILRKNAMKFDSSISDCSIKDIDEETLRSFVAKAYSAGRVPYQYTNKKDILQKLDLLHGDRVKQSGRLLFSNKEPVEVQAAVFAGTNKLTFLDIKQFKGNIFQLLKVSESYVKERINWRAKLETGTREEIPEIPVRAITEAVVNSLCHRDYQAPESNKVAVYKDRVDIWNPGDFPQGYTPDDFIKRELPSILRNPMIANILYLSEDIEKWGSGLRRIKEACDADAVPVRFEVLKYGFSVVFDRNIAANKGVVEKGAEKVGENERRILELITENRHITYKELSLNIGIAEKNIYTNIEKLKEKGLLRRVGPDKGGHWEIIEKDAEPAD